MSLKLAVYRKLYPLLRLFEVSEVRLAAEGSTTILARLNLSQLIFVNLFLHVILVEFAIHFQADLLQLSKLVISIKFIIVSFNDILFLILTRLERLLESFSGIFDGGVYAVFIWLPAPHEVMLP